MGGNNFFYRLEYNFARPYTYAHLSEEFNYGNQGFCIGPSIWSELHGDLGRSEMGKQTVLWGNIR